MTGLFHREKKQVNFIEKVANKKVNVIAQCAYTFIPIFALFMRIWVFARIEKLGKGTLYTAIILAVFFGIYGILYSFHIASEDGDVGIVIAGLISTQGIMLFFLIRWSREWNKKIDECISKMIQEKHIGDCIECGQKLDKFYVNCPHCNKIFLKKGCEYEAEIMNKKYGLV